MFEGNVDGGKEFPPITQNEGPYIAGPYGPGGIQNVGVSVFSGQGNEKHVEFLHQEVERQRAEITELRNRLNSMNDLIQQKDEVLSQMNGALSIVATVFGCSSISITQYIGCSVRCISQKEELIAEFRTALAHATRDVK